MPTDLERVPEAAWSELTTAVEEVTAARDRLTALVASLPARDVETGPEDVFGDFEASTELRIVAECVALELGGAIASLESIRRGRT